MIAFLLLLFLIVTGASAYFIIDYLGRITEFLKGIEALVMASPSRETARRRPDYDDYGDAPPPLPDSESAKIVSEVTPAEEDEWLRRGPLSTSDGGDSRSRV